MKVAKPAKLPILTRTILRAGQNEFHVAAMLGFPLESPRALFDEMAFWRVANEALGEQSVLDEGVTKHRGEVLAAGAFFAPGGKPLPASYARVRLGSVDKRVAVIGDRTWQDKVPTAPAPLTTMPIDWAHAYGGPTFKRNPLGVGATPVERDGRMVHPLPNLERYGALMRSPTEHPDPACFLPMDVTFAQRRSRSGTYDKRWIEQDFPGIARDADLEFFNVASEDQWIQGPFRGDEEFLIENMHPDKPRLEGRLPGLRCRSFVTHRTPEGEAFLEIPLACDTVWLFPSLGAGVVIFHGVLRIAEDDAHDVVHLVCACEESTSSRPVEHYAGALARRLDKDKGVIGEMSDSDLMPSRESGVAPNLGELDMTRWVRSENLTAKNMRRGKERYYANARAEVEAEGLDPKDYGLAEVPPEPAEPPLDDLDALADYMEANLARGNEQLQTLDGQAATAAAAAREMLVEMGEDPDAIVGPGAKPKGGPPQFSADEHLRAMQEMADDCRAAGRPNALLEEALASPQYRIDVHQQERDVRDAYRRGAHLLPAAAPMDEEASARARVVVGLALETAESLASRDFTGANLAGAKLAGIDLRGALLECADLSECDLSDANLEGAVLTRANLRGAKLKGARLAGANLGSATLCDAVFDEADLTDATLWRADLRGAYLSGAKLGGAEWFEAKIGEVDFSDAMLSQCVFMKTDLKGAHFQGADLSHATLFECELDGADFSGANIEKLTLVTCTGESVVFRGARAGQVVFAHGSSLPKADFSDASLPKACLRTTVLTGARFDRADLAGADLSQCDATGASFERATMKGSMLVRTQLTGASLRGANLMDAIVSKALISGADFMGANLYRADLSRVIGDPQTSFAEAEVKHVRHLPKAELPKQGEP